MRVPEPFSEQERERLAPFVTDLDAPVFALRGLPETTRAALFARYSRYRGTLRRLLLDEFADELEADVARRASRGARRSSTSACSASTETTPSRSSGVCTSPASGSRTS